MKGRAGRKRLKVSYRYLLSVTAVPMLLACGCAAAPRDGGHIRTERLPDGALLLTFHVHDVDGATLARRIGELAGVVVLPDPVREGVTVCAESLPWRLALNAVADEMDCTIVEESPEVFRVTDSACCMPLEYRDANVGIVLELLARGLGRHLELPPNLHGRVTGYYSHRSREAVRIAMDAIAAVHGLRVKWPDPCSDSPIVVSVR